MKIIFLDIDGVLNHQIWFEKVQHLRADRQSKEDYRFYFDPFAVGLLNDLTDATGAKIVVSSSWRLGRTVEELKKILKENGVTGEVIDKTPHLSFEDYANYSYSVPRGCEIKAWMELNKEKLGESIGKYRNYVIFDDDSDMLYWQRNNYFQVDSYCGLTPNLIYRAKNFLCSNIKSQSTSSPNKIQSKSL